MALRRAHLVGSLPGESAGEAMRLAVERLGDDLAYLPDGETGDRRNWVIPMIESLREHPDLDLAKDGDWSDYDKIPRLRVKPGHRLYGASLDLGIALTNMINGADPATELRKATAEFQPVLDKSEKA